MRNSEFRIPNSEFPAFSPLFSSFTPYHIFWQKSRMKFGLSVLLCALPKLIHDNRTKIRDFPGFFLTSFRLKFTIEARTRRMPCPCPRATPAEQCSALRGLLPGNARRCGASCRAILGAAGPPAEQCSALRGLRPSQCSALRDGSFLAFRFQFAGDGEAGLSQFRIPNSEFRIFSPASPTPKKGRCAPWPTPSPMTGCNLPRTCKG